MEEEAQEEKEEPAKAGKQSERGPIKHVEGLAPQMIGKKRVSQTAKAQPRSSSSSNRVGKSSEQEASGARKQKKLK